MSLKLIKQYPIEQYRYFLLSKENVEKYVLQICEKVNTYNKIIVEFEKKYNAINCTVGSNYMIRGIGLNDISKAPKGFIQNHRKPETRRRNGKILFEFLPNEKTETGKKIKEEIDNINKNYCSYREELIKFMGLNLNVQEVFSKPNTLWMARTEVYSKSNGEWIFMVPIINGKCNINVHEELQEITNMNEIIHLFDRKVF